MQPTTLLAMGKRRFQIQAGIIASYRNAFEAWKRAVDNLTTKVGLELRRDAHHEIVIIVVQERTEGFGLEQNQFPD